MGLKGLANSFRDYGCDERTAAFTSVSFAVNAAIGAAKLVMGVYMMSAWFMTNALYYILLCAARGNALKKYRELRRVKDPARKHRLEFAVYQKSGLFICMLGLSYLLVCLRMCFKGDYIVYSGVVVYAVALVAVTKMGFAVYGAVLTRRLENPITSALKMICVTDALVSIVVAQCAILNMKNTVGAVRISGLFGMAVSVLIAAAGMVMLIKNEKASGKQYRVKE